MFLAVHAATGALIGTAFHKPAFAFLLGLVSHFFLDMIPHGDSDLYENYQRGEGKRDALMHVILDAVASSVMVAAFFLFHDFSTPVSVAAGIIGSVLPDALVGLAHCFRPKKERGLVWRLDWFKEFHWRNHGFIINHVRRFQKDISAYSGLALQGLMLVVMFKLIF